MFQSFITYLQGLYEEQAGAELCQAQERLGLAKPALLSKKLWLSYI